TDLHARPTAFNARVTDLRARPKAFNARVTDLHARPTAFNARVTDLHARPMAFNAGVAGSRPPLALVELGAAPLPAVAGLLDRPPSLERGVAGRDRPDEEDHDERDGADDHRVVPKNRHSEPGEGRYNERHHGKCDTQEDPEAVIRVLQRICDEAG